MKKYIFFSLLISLTGTIFSQNPSWNYVSDFPSYRGNIKKLAIDTNGYIYYEDQESRSLFYSVDAGNNWLSANNNLAINTVGDLEVSPFTNTLFVGLQGWGGIEFTSNQGNSWGFQDFFTIPNSGQHLLITQIDVNPFNNKIIVQGFNPAGSTDFYTSSNNGASWNLIAQYSIFDNTELNDIAFITSSDALAGNPKQNGLYKTTNQAVAWSLFGFSNERVFNVRKDVQGILTLTAESGIYRSEDTAQTWIQVSTLKAQFLHYDEVFGIYYAACGNKLYTSDDGIIWSNITYNLSAPIIYHIVTNNQGKIFLSLGQQFLATKNLTDTVWYFPPISHTGIADIAFDTSGSLYVNNLVDEIHTLTFNGWDLISNDSAMYMPFLSTNRRLYYSENHFLLAHENRLFSSQDLTSFTLLNNTPLDSTSARFIDLSIDRSNILLHTNSYTNTLPQDYYSYSSDLGQSFSIIDVSPILGMVGFSSGIIDFLIKDSVFYFLVSEPWANPDPLLHVFKSVDLGNVWNLTASFPGDIEILGGFLNDSTIVAGLSLVNINDGNVFNFKDSLQLISNDIVWSINANPKSHTLLIQILNDSYQQKNTFYFNSDSSFVDVGGPNNEICRNIYFNEQGAPFASTDSAIYELTLITEIAYVARSQKNTCILFPNPTNNLVNITNNKELEKIEVINIQGDQVLIRSKTINAIDLSNVAKGTYIIKLGFIDKSSEYHRVIVE